MAVAAVQPGAPSWPAIPVEPAGTRSCARFTKQMQEESSSQQCGRQHDLYKATLEQECKQSASSKKEPEGRARLCSRTASQAQSPRRLMTRAACFCESSGMKVLQSCSWRRLGRRASRLSTSAWVRLRRGLFSMLRCVSRVATMRPAGRRCSWLSPTHRDRSPALATRIATVEREAHATACQAPEAMNIMLTKARGCADQCITA